MKKLITLLLVLTGFVCTANAENIITIFFQPNADWASNGATFKLYGYVKAEDTVAGSVQNFVKYSDSGNKIYKATMDIDTYPFIKFGRCSSDGNTPWNTTNGTYVPSGSRYFYMTGSGYGDWNYYDVTSSTYFPDKYYLMSNATGSWHVVSQMIESDDVYSYRISDAATYAGKKFAFAMGDAFAADGSFSDGTDNNNWLKVIRPVAGSTQYNIGFANYAGSTITNTKDAGAALWFVEENNNCGEIIISYTPSSNSFSVACRHSVGISIAGYATYSNAYNYKVVGATAYTISSAGDRATLNSLGEGAEIPAGTGIIIAGSSTEYTVLPSNGTATIGSNLLIGSNNYTYNITGKYSEDSFYTAYIFANGTNGVGFYKLDESDKTLAAHKAFLAVPITNSSRSFIGFDDEVTAINAIGNDVNNTNAPIYNLQGVRLNKLQKGLNIVNGKKILVK